MELGYGQDPVIRVFFVHEKRRKVVAIFIFDRSKAQEALASGGLRPDAPIIRLWTQFEGIFVQFYYKDRELFLQLAFEVHMSHEKVQGTLAETLLGVKGSRLTIVATLDRFLRDGLLPQPDPKDASSASTSSAEAGSRQSSPKITPPAKRSRRSLGSPELSGLEEPPSEELSREGAGVMNYVQSLFDLTEQEARRGNIAPLAFEEFVLEYALHDTELLDAFKDMRDSPKAFSTQLVERWRAAVIPCGACMPPLFKVDGPGGSLNIDDCRIYFARFISSVVGSRAHMDRMTRKEQLICIRDEWSALQMFKPRRSQTLIEHALNARRYNWGCAVVHPRSIFSAINSASAQSTNNLDAFDQHKKAMTEKNEFSQTLLSHRTIFLLYLAKEIGEISDVKWLLVSSLFVMVMTGELLDINKMKQLCITGPALVTRARQLTWRLQKSIAAKINAAPGVHSVATDDTEIAKCNAGSRAVSFVDVDKKRPDYEHVSCTPTGRKTSTAGALALVDSIKEKQITFTNQQGGSSDNAPNALLMISQFFDLAQQEVNGADIVTIFNGVPLRCICVGSQVHILHLANGHFRDNSFGSKVGHGHTNSGPTPL